MYMLPSSYINGEQFSDTSYFISWKHDICFTDYNSKLFPQQIHLITDVYQKANVFGIINLVWQISK